VTSVVPESAPRVEPAKRVPGKPFAIAFGTFLIVGTIVFYFFAQRAEIARQRALERMESGETVAPAAAD
jgi:hypothetical protein